MSTHLNITWLQRGLLLLLYGLIALMIIFSFMAAQNLGQEGYDHCIKEKCDTKGEAYCTKYREISNCCQGAGGQIASDDQKYICTFEN